MKLVSFSPNSAFWLLGVSFLLLDGSLGNSEEKGFLRGDGGMSRKGDGDGGVSREGDLKHLSALKNTGDQLHSKELRGGRHIAPLPVEDATRQRIVPDLLRAAKAVAWVISKEHTKILLGQTVKLTDFVYEPPSPPMPPMASFKIVFLLGIDETNLFVLVEGVDVEGLYCLGFTTIQTKASLSVASARSAFEADLNRERHVLGDSTKAEAVEGRASSSSSYLARIYGVEPVTLVDDILVFDSVLLFGDFSKKLGYMLSRPRSFPHDSKAHLGRRLVLLFLLLKLAGIPHDDFDLRQIFLRRGESSILSILSAFSRFGEEVRRTFSDVSSPFTAPELMLATRKSRGNRGLSRSEDAPKATPAADMWSLGAILFFIFTGKFVTHGMTDCSNNAHRLDAVTTQPPEGEDQQDDVDSILKTSEVPVRWRELILKLLRPKEEDRISAEKVFVSFPDLLGLTS
ncbi:hypothetical protein Emag_002063 [Eimeria magna]